MPVVYAVDVTKGAWGRRRGGEADEADENDDDDDDVGGDDAGISVDEKPKVN